MSSLTHDNFHDRPVRPGRRLLPVEVRDVVQLSPNMKRITVGSSSLSEFAAVRPAQWVKVFVPSEAEERPNGRAYTIRNFYERDSEMDLDFVLHDHGPCSIWARQAKVGDIIQIAGPRTGFRLDPSIRRLFIGGDETALPAIGAIIETMTSDISVTAFIEVADIADRQQFVTTANVSVAWFARAGASAGGHDALQSAMMSVNITDDASAVWFAAEATVVREVRRHFQALGLDHRRLTTSGYWKKGETAFRDAEGDQ
ncbi:siderophore-interacting protein [Rhizobium panacihumi]|uniref:siderophore-interacting protein n=1 Tax=Rhizobium panacihumi TaxID=2008450 RepID=UPI003D7BBAE8